MINQYSGKATLWRGGMKRSMLIILFLFFMISLARAGDVTKGEKQTGQLTVIIVGLENDEGQVKVALCDSNDNFSSDGDPFKGLSAKIKDTRAECTFTGIPYGIYAIKIYHDENGNSELDKNFMGIPKERYGFSNNARGKFGPATWDDAQFTFNAKGMSIEITVE